MLKTAAFAAQSARAPLAPFEIERREPGPSEVLIDILYCGVCHSDIHQARGEWGRSRFPMVPGHEIVGRVAQVGSAVDTFRIGDAVGVGCFVDSCRECAKCRAGEEQYCDQGMTSTYNSTERGSGAPTYGGYSTRITVDAAYVLRIPEQPAPVAAGALIAHRRRLAGSMIGGIRETQEMLDFCAEHGVASDIELIGIDRINEAYERMLQGDVRYRFVIDLASLREGA